MHAPHPNRARFLGLAAAGLLAVGLAACSPTSTDPSDDSGGNGTSTDLSDLTAEVTSWDQAPTAPIEVESGKNIVSITCGSAGVSCVRAANGAVAAGELLGWNITVVDGQSAAPAWVAAIENAIASHADGIILNAVPPEVVQSSIAEAQAAGIPVIETLSGTECALVDACVDIDRALAGEYAARWVAADSGGSGQVLLVNSPEFASTVQYNDAFREALATECPDCAIVDEIDFNFASMSERLPSEVSSSLTTNPTINYIAMPFDSIAPFIAQGVRQSGLSDVRSIGVGADKPGVDSILAGEVTATTGVPAEWLGWHAIDDLARTFAGESIEATTFVPTKLILEDNLPTEEAGWTGDLDYPSIYADLWGK